MPAQPIRPDAAARVRQTLARKTTTIGSSRTAGRGEGVVRFTADLERTQHRWLTIQAAQEGLKSVSIVRALLAEAQDDPELLARALARAAAMQ